MKCEQKLIGIQILYIHTYIYIYIYIYILHIICDYGCLYIQNVSFYIGSQLHENEKENSNTSSAGSSKA